MSKEKLVVIGSGISGLSASFFLSNKYDVILLEKNDYLGGHTRTKEIKYNNDLINIDTGFIVFNNANYPVLTNFLNFLDVKTENSNMSFSVSLLDPNIEYGGSGFSALFAQPKNFFSIKFFFLINEIRRFYKHCNNIEKLDSYKDVTLEQYLKDRNYSKDLLDLHIYPMVSSIWSSNQSSIRNFPFISFLNFFKNHGLFDLRNRPQWKFIKNGSNSYIKKLLSKNYFEYKTKCLVKRIIRKNNKITIQMKNKKDLEVNKIVLATHADQALSLLDNPDKKEIEILSNFQYTKNKAYLHSDEKFMPKYKSAWSSWNFKGNNINDSKFSLTYWMNNLQKINSSKNYFVTINPKEVPVDYYDSTTFEHPIYNLKTIESQKNLLSIQGISNTFYCGSYCGYGFHEDGIQSAAYVADILNVEIPLDRNINFKSRLYY